MDRVVRVLKLLQKSQPVSRGTIQTIFKYTPYDEVKRLGLPASYEETLRREKPAGTGLLVVGQVIPRGPSANILESGDILLKINDRFLTTFVDLEGVTDEQVGKTVKLLLQRGERTLHVDISVQDLHSITPDRYVEVGGGVLHELSYQMAFRYVFSRIFVPPHSALT